MNLHFGEDVARLVSHATGTCTPWQTSLIAVGVSVVVAPVTVKPKDGSLLHASLQAVTSVAASVGVVMSSTRLLGRSATVSVAVTAACFASV